MIVRTIEKDIQQYLRSKNSNILFIWGPRRSGKTTLLKKISKKHSVPIFDFDLLTDREKFIPEKEMLAKLSSAHKIILIDEIQNYPESTVILKILHDHFRVKIIATGSSELRKKSQEFDSLAGRYEEIFCLPLSVEEIRKNYQIEAYEEHLFFKNTASEIQIYGSYPEIYTTRLLSKRIEKLQYLLDAYVLKDIITIYQLRNTKLAKDILTKIALQIGSEVSLREIASSLSANVQTVTNYVEIFIRNYILIPLPAFSTNLRRVVSTNRKLFFYDLGIRNILIRDFRDLDLRPDKGGVFENFIISEIEKKKRTNKIYFNTYFYREYGGKEIDIVLEDYKRQYRCLEVKYGKKTASSIFPLPHVLTTINNKNYFAEISKLAKTKNNKEFLDTLNK